MAEVPFDPVTTTSPRTDAETPRWKSCHFKTV